ncbi:hypothetical protein [Tabrizicola sp.]|uniref:hypothetical protein n=1 Tax=Tabrizicola sp. TaxID=2005166 RepID=UPI002734175E|nr:hypothetical protein [Tabrizicola sp.]MDP3194380.1 hypothetical protein [Tabrizicola sp.]
MSGKSLKAMAADKDNNAVKKTDLWKVDPRVLVEVEGFNLRDYDDPEVIAQIEAFADAYAAGRYVPALIVWTDDEGRISPVEGHLRRRGAMLAIERGHDLPYLECVGFKGSDAERIEVMLRSADGLQLRPLNTAIGYLRLHRKGYTNQEIAQKMHRTVARVEQLLLLGMANSDVHALVKSGKVSADAAIEAVRLHGEAAGEYMQSTLNKGGKVTRGAVRGAGIPPKVAGTVTGAFGELFGKRTRGGVLEGLARWEASGMPKGQKIEVDAAALLALKEAHDALESITEKRSSRASERAAKASQGNLEGLE